VKLQGAEFSRVRYGRIASR